MQSLSGSILTLGISDPLNGAYPISDLSVIIDGQECSILSGTYASFTCQLPLNSNSNPLLSVGEHYSVITIKNLGRVLPA